MSAVADDKPLMDIAIRDGRIAAIEPSIAIEVEQRIGAEGRAAIPGLLKPHLYLEKASFTGACERAPVR